MSAKRQGAFQDSFKNRVKRLNEQQPPRCAICKAALPKERRFFCSEACEKQFIHPHG